MFWLIKKRSSHVERKEKDVFNETKKQDGLKLRECVKGVVTRSRGRD